MWNNIVPNVGFGVGFIALLLAVYFYLKTKPKRRIESYIEYLTSLVKIGEEVKSDIEINYKGENIENINKIRLIMNNAGNKEIKNDNVIKPIVISVPGNKIIDFKADTSSKHFEPDIILDVDNPSCLQIAPNYWEKGDTLNIEILSIGPKAEPLIAGVLGPPRYECRLTYAPLKMTKTFLILNVILFILTALIVIFVGLRLFNLIDVRISRVFVSIISLIGGPFWAIYLWYTFSRYKTILFRQKYPRR